MKKIYKLFDTRVATRRQVMVFTLFYIMAFYVLAALVLQVFHKPILSSVVTDVIFAFLSYVLYVFFFTREYKNPVKRFDAKGSFGMFTMFGVLFLGCYLAQITSSVIVNTIGDSAALKYSTAFTKEAQLAAMLSLFIAPVCEEIIIRGVLFNMSKKVGGRLFGYILSLSVFVLMHGTIVHIFAAGVGGIIVTYVYEKTDSLGYAILFHILFNTLAAFTGGLPIGGLLINPIFLTTIDLLFLLMLVYFVKEDILAKSLANVSHKKD